MVRSFAAASVLFLLLAGSRSASAAAAPNKAKVHGIALSGTISRIDSARMTFAVRDAGGHEVALSWTRATKVIGGELKLGELVTLRYFDRDSRHIAATIRLGSPQAPAASTTAGASPPASPTRSAAKSPSP